MFIQAAFHPQFKFVFIYSCVYSTSAPRVSIIRGEIGLVIYGI